MSCLVRAVALICLCLWDTALAKRATTYAAKARSRRLSKAAAQSGNSTSYGVPVWQVLTRATAADHFSKVRGPSVLPSTMCTCRSTQLPVAQARLYHQAQYAGQDKFELRYGLTWPSAKPNSTSPILLFTSQESALE